MQCDVLSGFVSASFLLETNNVLQTDIILVVLLRIIIYSFVFL